MEIIPPVAYAVPPGLAPGPLIAFLGTGELAGFYWLVFYVWCGDNDLFTFVIAANKVNNMTTNG